MATVFSGQAIHVDDKGNLALVGVEVEDDDPNFNNGDAFEAGDTPEGEIGGKEFSPISPSGVSPAFSTTN